MSTLTTLTQRAPAVATFIRSRLLGPSEVVVGNAARVVSTPKAVSAVRAAQTASARRPTVALAAAAVAGGAVVTAADFASATPEEAISIFAALSPEERADFLNQAQLSSENVSELLIAADNLSAVGSAYSQGVTETTNLFGVSEADRKPMGMARDVGTSTSWTQDERQRYTRMMAGALAQFGNSEQALEAMITIMSMAPADRSYLYDELNARRF